MIGTRKEVDVFLQSNTSALFQYFLIQELKDDITLTADVAIDDTIINVSAGHGFQVGDVITLWCNNVFEQATVVNVNVNAITIDIPSANIFSISGNCVVTRGVKELNLNGSVTPVELLYKPRNSFIPVDLSGFKVTMQHTAAGDDGKFGGIAALTNGIYFRQVNGHRVNLGNYVCNKCFKDRGAYVDYTSKGPAGSESTEILFNIESLFRQAIRINPRNNEYFFGKIRDDLTGLDSFTISLIGSFTEGE